jgi:anti-sigma B factor antagonist
MAEARSPSPEITATKQGNALVVKIGVKLLDDKSLKLMTQTIDQAAADTELAVIVLDLSRVELLPSLGLGTLIQLQAKCKARNQSLKLAAVHPQVRQVFSITKLNRVLDLVDSVESAVQ